MTRKIAIVAKGGTSALAPWRDETWEIWGMPWVIYPRVDRLFDLHTQAFWGETEKTRKFEAEWAQKAKRVYAGKAFCVDPTREHRFKNVTVYPLSEVMDFLPIPYLENSIAYMMALALLEHAKGDAIEVMGLWGVHMRGAPEYADERASVTYLAGLASGMGIDVHVPPGNPLFMSAWQAGRYGPPGGKRMINPFMAAAGALPNSTALPSEGK